MYGVSPRFLVALRASHVLATRVEVLRFGQVVGTVRVVDGTVTVDATQAVRRRCDLTVVDPTGVLIPVGAGSLLAPYGDELRIAQGIRYPDGTSELVPLGIFGIFDVEVASGADGVQLRIVGYDRARRLQDARWEDVYPVTAGQDYAAAITALLQNRLGVPSTRFPDSVGALTPAGMVLGGQASNDPLADAISMATSAGCELFVDPTGTWVLQRIPDYTIVVPSATYAAGQAKILGVTRRWTREELYNACVVTGSRAGASPVRSIAYDTDPTSATYYYGAFGKKPFFYDSSLITTQAQADATAAALLNKKLGAAEVVTFDAIKLQ